ncbi:MAG: choice-of-anchor Q domain-containing protein [Polyangiaceae bacterium]
MTGWSVLGLFVATLALAGCGDDVSDSPRSADAALDAGADGPVADGSVQDTGLDGAGGTVATDAAAAKGIPIPIDSVVKDAAPDEIVVEFDRAIAKTGDLGFVIRGGSELSVTSVTAQGKSLTLHLSKAVEYLQNAITWSYDDAVGGVTNLRSLRLIHVRNELSEPNAAGKQYFVSVSGVASNTGLSESSPWSIEQAVAKAGPGDRVWIKAGDYGNKQLAFKTDGTAGKRIWFEGYKTSTNGVPDPVTSLYYAYGKGAELQASELPLFDGGDQTGTGFNIVGLQYVTFRNLTFRNYRQAILGGFEPANGADDPAKAVRYCLFERIAVTNVGGGTAAGAFILLGEKDHNAFNTIRSCRGKNSSMVGFFLAGRGSAVEDSEAHCDRDDSSGGEAQDYYFALKGVENVSLRNRAHRVIQVNHGGHGYALRGESPSPTQYNLVQDCESINIAGAYELRNETSAYNVVRRCVSSVDGAINGESTGGIDIMGGAHHNLVEQFSARGVSVGIAFKKNAESTGNSCGHDNLIRNSEFYAMPQYEGTGGYSLKHAILGSAASTENGPSITDNKIVNCTFHDFSYFVRLYPASKTSGVTASGNQIINSSISKGLYYKHPDTVADSGFTFDHCNIHQADANDDGFAAILGTNGNIAAAPGFTDESSFDFHLAAASGNVDKAKDSGDVVFDFDGKERPQGGKNDIGAYELP